MLEAVVSIRRVAVRVACVLGKALGSPSHIE